MAVVDVAGVIANQAAHHIFAGDSSGSGGGSDGAGIAAHEAAELVVGVAAGTSAGDVHVSAAVVHGAGNGKAGVCVVPAAAQAHQTAHGHTAGNSPGDGAAADQVCHALGGIVFIQLHLRIAHQTAHIGAAGDRDIFQVQVLDGGASDGIEEAYAGPAILADLHVGDRVALTVKAPGERMVAAADAGEFHTVQVQIIGQLVVFAQCFGVCSLRQFFKLGHGGDGHPCQLTAAQLIPRGAMEEVFGGAFEPQHPVAVLHRGQ